MEEATSKEKILKKIRNALINRANPPFADIDWESSVYIDNNEPLDILFAQEFTKIAGKFVFCENENEFAEILKTIASNEKWEKIHCITPEIQSILEQSSISFTKDENDFLAMEVGITTCEALVARTGSIMMSSKLASGRRMIGYPPIHIVVAYSEQLVYDLKDAFEFIKKKYQKRIPSMITMVSGPSRTADIEKTLVMGAHGPKDLYLFLIDKKN